MSVKSKDTKKYIFKNKHRESIARDVAYQYLRDNSSVLYNDGIHTLTEKGLARAIARAPQHMIYALNLAATKGTKDIGSFIRVNNSGAGTVKLVVSEGNIKVVHQGPRGDRIVTPAKSKFGFTLQQLRVDKNLKKSLEAYMGFLGRGGKPEELLKANQAGNIKTSWKDLLKELQQILEEMDDEEFFYTDPHSEDVTYIKPDEVLNKLEKAIDKAKQAAEKTTNQEAKAQFKELAEQLHVFKLGLNADVLGGVDMGHGKYKHETDDVIKQKEAWEAQLEGITDYARDMFDKYTDISNSILKGKEEEDE